MCYFVPRIQQRRRKRIRIKSIHERKTYAFQNECKIKKKTFAYNLLQYHCQHFIINRPNQQLSDYTMASKENGARVINFNCIRFDSNCKTFVFLIYLRLNSNSNLRITKSNCWLPSSSLTSVIV